MGGEGGENFYICRMPSVKRSQVAEATFKLCGYLDASCLDLPVRCPATNIAWVDGMPRAFIRVP